MLELLKKLFSIREGEQTVVVVNDDGTKPSASYRLHPVGLWLITGGTLVVVIILVVGVIRFTPVGGLIYNQQGMRDSVIAIQHKVMSLQDTLEARNMQLNQIKNIIVSGKDTSMGALSTENLVVQGGPPPHTVAAATPQKGTAMHITTDAVLINNLFDNTPQFPVPYPIDGTPTRTFNTQNGHFGLDIAASSGDAFKAVADGVIINQEWTLNYGYVLTVQHAGGIISIYKHAQTLNKAIGEAVRQGDILGTIGNVGILSSGPHLHIEIWEHGIPQNPHSYLIKS